MNTPRNFTIAALALASIASACGDPCLPTFNADTVIVAADDICFITTDEASGSTGGTSTDITSGTGGTGDTSSTTADPVSPLDPKPDALPVCIAIPGAGEEWGPCMDGQCAEGLSCKVSGKGDVCIAACDVPGPCNTAKCIGGTCDMDLGACVAPCKAVGDPCPLPGMQCLFGAAPLCAHPF